jgi:hypothetical protein
MVAVVAQSVPSIDALIQAFQSLPDVFQAIVLITLLGLVASVVALAATIKRKGGVRSAFGLILSRLLGRPEAYSYTLFIGLIVACIVGLGISGWAFSNYAQQTQMGSTYIAELVIGYTTNFFLWALLVVLLVVGLFFRLGTTLAKETAKQTRYSQSEIERMGAEAKSTDGTSRLLGGRRHSKDQLRAKLLRVFNGEDINEGIEDLDSLSPTDALHDEEAEHGGELADPVAGALPAPEDIESVDPMQADVTEAAGRAERLAEELDYEPARDRPVGETDDEIVDEDAGTDTVDEEEDSLLDPMGVVKRKIQLMRMDAATAASLDELFARFVVPAILTGLGAFTVLGTFWVHPLLYLPILFGSLLSGAIVYTGFKWKRRRNVEKTRQTRTRGGWYACDALAKGCETDRGTDFYVVWMGGRQYFGFDKHRVARKVADRWHQRINGEVVAPAIHEHFAKSATSMMPLAYHIEYKDSRRSRGAIYDTIADVIRSADDAILPKMHLGQMVVEAGPGVGHDPDLVGEVYEDMVGDAIEEFEITLRDTDGELVPVTLVTLRTSGVPLDMEELRSEFSNQISPEDEPLYELPEVEESFTIEDSLTVGVPPGINPENWNPETATAENADTNASAAPSEPQSAD